MGKPTPDEKFQDKNTGETVIRHNVPEKMIPEIQKHFDLHAANERNFSGLSNQYFGALDAILDLRKKMITTQQDLQRQLQVTCKKMGLEKDDWIYVLTTKCMELRKPPEEGDIKDG